MFNFIKFRHLFWFLGTFLTFTLLLGIELGAFQLSNGAALFSKMAGLPTVVFGVAALYFGTRGLLDFVDQGKLYEKALETPQGAGLAMIAVSLTRISIAIVLIAMMAVFI